MPKQSKPKIIVITGPTASGKTSLSIKLAKQFGGFVISADSRQIYKGLNIGTAKIEKDEMNEIPHFMIDIVSPKKNYSVAEYAHKVHSIIKNKHKTGIPFIVGGTGFYIDAVIYNFSLPPVKKNPQLREKLAKKSREELLQELKAKDPKRAKTIDPKNKIRLIRALEIIYTLKKPVPLLKKSSPYEVLMLGIAITREKLRHNLESRLKEDLRHGLIEEVENLQNSLSWKRLYELGLEYRYIAEYLKGTISYEAMKEKIKHELWHYAKRQMTWFKRDKNIHWIKNQEEAEQCISVFLNPKDAS
ncbi:MAG: tRNA (adenosine(37)-N6)-dimethylallyltransferase MiaA [Candidatus Harrisonbacteria bacterium RIFOXYD1_FULL_40_9]|uniref:tRNA dimethylallyltransferase n=1 Tax=Candidatus Harrisonbacteria bacterium RIFOXYD1_FULL_40_9 TaxID=1798412 RepID=A0A1G2A0A5_9BACT|nr:MAG: tRNA (adenosine(37)-N6)-dimethylallyltransferase MiaA [Candidatus Harrisonbacteria bacterium RIFOXYD1_FULL_40_9]